jgi:hypothetical protein
MTMKKQKATQQDILLAAYEALIERHDGRIGPRVLLEEARDSASVFHDYFEWDDDKASEQFRLIQAGQLIRRWKGAVMRIDESTKRVVIDTVRRVQSPGGQRSKGGDSYQTVEDIMSDPVKRDDMVRTVLRELMAYRKRYAELLALSEVWQAIDDAVDLHDAAGGGKAQDASTDRPTA